MDNLVLVLILTTSLVLIPLGYYYLKDPKAVKAWLFSGTRKSLGIWKGIILALIFAVFAALMSGCSTVKSSFEGGRWVQDQYAYAGLDYVRNTSPQCVIGESGGISDNITSNLRIGSDIWENKDESVEVVGEWTHHSCAFNSDRNNYDGLGLGVRINW